MGRIKVMEVVKSFNVESHGGGAERFAIDLARSLDSNRFDVSIYGLWDYGNPLEHERLHTLRKLGIPSAAAARWNEHHNYRSMWNAMLGLRSAVQQHPVDIVNTHSEFADIAVLPLLTLRHPPKLVRTVHYPYRVEWIKRPLRRYLFSYFLFPLLFDLEIGVSQRLVTQLNRRWMARILHRKARLIHNAIDLNRFANIQVNVAEKRRSLGLPVDAFMVGAIGRLTEQKGFTYLIEAASMLVKQKPQVFFLIVGDGELATPLQSQAVQGGVASHVIFAGSRSDVEELLACVDLFVSSSLWEGLPTVILESMAAGVPIVATAIPGTQELIQDQHNGWLVPPANATALARGIQAAVEDAGKRQEFANRNLQYVQPFSMKSIAAEYENCYFSIMQRIHHT